jgi:hypothetical protein
MRLHYYGRLDNMESCYSFQEFEMGSVTLFLQNAPRFGYEPATMMIKNPAMFVKKEDGYHRYVIEDFSLDVVDGVIKMDEDILKDIVRAINEKD